MKNLILGLTLAFGIFGVSSPACGQAETTALSFTFTTNQDFIYPLTGSPEGSMALDLSLKQTFEIDPSQVSAITAETSVAVSVNGFEFNGLMGYDPEYKVGDNSATFNVTGGFSSIPITAEMKLSWKKGHFTVSLKGGGLVSTSMTTIANLPTNAIAKPAALPPGHPMGSVSSSVILQNGSGVITATRGYAAIQMSSKSKGGPTADNGFQLSLAAKTKSKNLVAAPIP